MNRIFNNERPQNFPILIGIHFILFIAVFFLVLFLQNGNVKITEYMLLRWDCQWYKSIAEFGYIFQENKQNNTAFFPLFPYFWKLLQTNTAAIMVANVFSFSLGLYFLKKQFNFSNKLILLYLSMPGLFYFAIPFSESLFFLFCTIFLIGLKKDDKRWIITGLVLAGLTRSAGTLFLPALFLLGIFYKSKNPAKHRMDVLLYCGIATATTLAVFYFQYINTGVWMAANKSMAHWNHSLRIPKYPFSTWGSTEQIRLDGAAFLIALTALCFLGYSAFNILQKKDSIVKDRPTIFSFLYFSGVLAAIVLFREGSLLSINRYIFATPFMVFFLYYFENKKFSLKQVGGLVCFLLVYWILFGIYENVNEFLDFALFSIYLTMYLFFNIKEKNIGSFIFYTAYAANIFLQAYMAVRYLNGKWVG